MPSSSNMTLKLVVKPSRVKVALAGGFELSGGIPLLVRTALKESWACEVASAPIKVASDRIDFMSKLGIVW